MKGKPWHNDRLDALSKEVPFVKSTRHIAAYLLLALPLTAQVESPYLGEEVTARLAKGRMLNQVYLAEGYSRSKGFTLGKVELGIPGTVPDTSGDPDRKFRVAYSEAILSVLKTDSAAGVDRIKQGDRTLFHEAVAEAVRVAVKGLSARNAPYEINVQIRSADLRMWDDVRRPQLIGKVLFETRVDVKVVDRDTGKIVAALVDDAAGIEGSLYDSIRRAMSNLKQDLRKELLR
jgi:hypothetical protein